jgi:hypothetical protein
MVDGKELVVACPTTSFACPYRNGTFGRGRAGFTPAFFRPPPPSAIPSRPVDGTGSARGWRSKPRRGELFVDERNKNIFELRRSAIESPPTADYVRVSWTTPSPLLHKEGVFRFVCTYAGLVRRLCACPPLFLAGRKASNDVRRLRPPQGRRARRRRLMGD